MTADSLPDPDDFAAYLRSLGDDITDKVRDETYRLAVQDAVNIIGRAAEVRQAAVTAGFSTDTAESMAVDFWTIASGLGES
ncbi:hypothetical protein [Streptomyces rimosus]|uniref:hypothetical protein n=1 Tax=Streptomyces rimosus TaxID=1927 RepID=UPI0004BFB694|nr:hypothetical protein [Streptomyces rimosus]